MASATPRRPHHKGVILANVRQVKREISDPLDRFVVSIDDDDDAAEQLLKEKIYARLNDPRRMEYDPDTDCWVYTGAWNEKGQGIIRVGAKPHPVSRVSAWLFIAGFELWGENTAVRTCRTPACFNYEHLKIFPDRISAWQFMLATNRVGDWTARRRRGRGPDRAA